jgi:Ser-tRNA(Ala) deacylase AlaX
MIGARCRKLFWENPYCARAEVTVLHVDGSDVLFDQTIAFSFSGGQESDTASFRGIPIISSRFEGLDILYTFPENHGLQPGVKGMMEIDWNKRNRLMRYHMLCELVLTVTNKYFGKIEDELKPEQIDHVGIVKVMARMMDKGAYVDFDHEDMRPHLPIIQEHVDRIICDDLPIEKGFMDEGKHERFWRIPGFALVPCGGTHVRSTRELGSVRLSRDRTSSKVTASGKAERIKIKLINDCPTSDAVYAVDC